MCQDDFLAALAYHLVVAEVPPLARAPPLDNTDVVPVFQRPPVHHDALQVVPGLPLEGKLFWVFDVSPDLFHVSHEDARRRLPPDHQGAAGELCLEALEVDDEEFGVLGDAHPKGRCLRVLLAAEAKVAGKFFLGEKVLQTAREGGGDHWQRDHDKGVVGD